MSNEELVQQVQQGVNMAKYMELLYTNNRNLIYRVALPFSQSCDMDDLMQEAYFGLVEAVQRFDIEQGYKFMTYAIHWIKTYVRRYVQNFGQTKRIPLHIQELMSKYHKFKRDYYNQYQVYPSEDIITKGLNISNQRLKALEKCIYESKTQSMDDLIPGTDNLTIGESVADDFNLEDSVINSYEDDTTTLWGFVGELDTRCQDVITSHYKGNMTLEGIAKEYGISRERVRQIERKGILYLKKKTEIQEMAGRYGYDCSIAYRGNFTRYKNNGSSVEELAIKRMEIDRKFEELKVWYLQQKAVQT